MIVNYRVKHLVIVIILVTDIVGTPAQGLTLSADKITSECRQTILACASRCLVCSGPGANHIIGHDNRFLALNLLKSLQM